MDVSVSLTALMALAPLLFLLAMAVKCSSPGPVLYRGRRIGRDGHPFVLYKFRSMVTSTDESGPRITRKGDPRVTGIGRLLRRTKLDELPQLFNTLIGDMSLVGPRPEDPEYVQAYSARQREVLRAKPGLTSPATLMHRDEEEWLDGPDWRDTYLNRILPAKLEMELAYLGRRTLADDIKVLVQTVSTLFARRVHAGPSGGSRWRT